jgi:hypothetical protein
MQNSNTYELKYYKYLTKYNQLKAEIEQIKYNDGGSSAVNDLGKQCIKNHGDKISEQFQNIFNTTFDPDLISKYIKLLKRASSADIDQATSTNPINMNKFALKNFIKRNITDEKTPYNLAVEEMKKLLTTNKLLTKKYDKKCFGYLANEFVDKTYTAINDPRLFEFDGPNDSRIKLIPKSIKLIKSTKLNEMPEISDSVNGFAQGTVTLFNSETAPILVNMYDVVFSIKNKKVQSFRYGTPIINEVKNKDQCILIKNYFRYYSNRQKKVILISLLDTCNFFGCSTIAKDKVSEGKMVDTESLEYLNDSSISFFNMFINSNVNNTITTTLSANTSENIDKYLNRLTEWITNTRDDTYAPVKVLLIKFLNKIFAHDIKTNTNYTTYKSLNREEFRYYMFCFISIIHLYLNEISPDTFVLAYHCKSGQDRTGTFYAINQMCSNVFYTKQILLEITKIAKAKIADPEIAFFDQILIKHFGPKNDNISIVPTVPTVSSITSVSGINKSMQSVKSVESVESDLVKFNNIDLLEYYLYHSFLITWLSTGFPGLKWNLGAKTENKFAYLITQNVSNAKMFEGYSQKRGS